MSKSSLQQRLSKVYTPEFRINAIRLAQSGGKSISQTAKDLGVPPATLHTWVSKTAKGEWSVADGNMTAVKVEKPAARASNISQKVHEQLSAEQKKSAELERQVRRLMQEREILKKTMAYCLDVPK